MDRGNFDEASLWFYNAAFEVAPVLMIDTHEIIPYTALVTCYDAIISQKADELTREQLDALQAKREEYRKLVSEWKRPDTCQH
jgi:hypothetical protein